MNRTSRVFIAGHRGLVGSALTRRLQAEGFTNLITRTHAELDLERPQDVEDFFAQEKPEYVFLAAAKVGGIYANSTYPVDFLLSNLKNQNNVIEASWRHGVKSLLFLGSSCIYPRLAPQPLKEEYLLSGPLEATNQPYAIAKIAGIELCEAYNRQYGTRFLSVMPTNLYGPGDTYNLQNSHVLPAFIRKFHLARLACEGDWQTILRDELSQGPIPSDVLANLAVISQSAGHHIPEPFKERIEPVAPLPHRPLSRGTGSIPPPLVLWGTGTPKREFLHSDDLADACIFLMRHVESLFAAAAESNGSRHLFNIGCGEDLELRELAEMVKRVVGFRGPVAWDSTKPDGTPRKLLDISRLQGMGWKPRIALEAGIRSAYQDYLSRYECEGARGKERRARGEGLEARGKEIWPLAPRPSPGFPSP
jgi:GDP-L-fucose synthase